MVTLRGCRRLEPRVLALRVSPAQLNFVSSVADSLAEAAMSRTAVRSSGRCHDDETPVGFVMISDEVSAPGYIAQYLWKLLVDEHGISARATARRPSTSSSSTSARPGIEVMWTSAGQGAVARSRSTSATASSARATSCSTTSPAPPSPGERRDVMHSTPPRVLGPNDGEAGMLGSIEFGS